MQITKNKYDNKNTTIQKKVCVACGNNKLKLAINLGNMPNANGLVSANDLKNVKSYPLKYYWCNKCGLLQQLDKVDSSVLFKNNYTYHTGVNEPAVRHFKELSVNISKKIKNRRFAVVIGSNDGTEISLLQQAGFNKVIGIEPAKNIAAIANKNNFKTINDFFTLKLSKNIIEKYGKADVVIANNVFAHIPNPKDMLSGMRNLLNTDGQIIIEAQWFRDVFKKLSIETLYAEHYYEWSIKAIDKISKSCGVKLIHVEHLADQQGGSIRCTLKLHGKKSKSLKKLEQKEIITGIYSVKKILQFQKRAEIRKARLLKLLKKLKSENKRIAIWAVPAKVPTLLNFCEIDSSIISAAYDSTPDKINKIIPKANIKVSDEKLLNANMKYMPDYILIGAWNYLDFATKKLKWFTDKKGTLINMLNGKEV